VKAGGQPFIRQRQAGIVRAAQSDDLAHVLAPSCLVVRPSVMATLGDGARRSNGIAYQVAA
jgi:hypothetical protein